MAIKGRSAWWLGFFATAALGGALTLVAYSRGLPDVFHRIRHFDKLFHFGVAGLLAFFLDGALRHRDLRVARIPIPIAGIVVLVPAALEEYAQRYSALRTSSVWDLAADVAGVTLLLAISRLLARARRPERRRATPDALE